MKKDFFDLMLKTMEKNKNVYLLFGGLGYPRVDEFLKKFPDRAFNTEASEQTMLDIAVGLAYSGKIPFCYTITPFLLRGFETIRTYINREKLHIVLIGAGRDDDYSKSDGFSHYAGDIGKVLGTMENIEQAYPKNKRQLQRAVKFGTMGFRPLFISLTR